MRDELCVERTTGSDERQGKFEAVLAVPVGAPFRRESSTACYSSIYEVRVYVVQPGDTVAKILERFNLAQEQLVALHPGAYFLYLKVGQRLIVYDQSSQGELRLCAA